MSILTHVLAGRGVEQQHLSHGILQAWQDVQEQHRCSDSASSCDPASFWLHTYDVKEPGNQSQLAASWLLGPPHAVVHAWPVGAGGASRLEWRAGGACRKVRWQGVPALTALAPWQPSL